MEARCPGHTATIASVNGLIVSFAEGLLNG